jgi:hypothetical protein
MNARSLPWLLVAIAESLAILWLGWMLFGNEPTPPTLGPSTSPPNAAPASPGDAAPAPRKHAEGPAQAAGQAESTAEGTTPRPAAPGPSEPMLGCLVHGTVTVQDGSSTARNLNLRLEPDAGGSVIARSYVSASDPAFAWADVPAGTYQLIAGGEGVAPSTQAIVVPPERTELRVDVSLTSTWLVRVLLATPDGRPWHEALSMEEQQRLGLTRFREVALIALFEPIPDELPRSELRTSPFTIGVWQSARGFARGGPPSKLPARYAGTLELSERRAVYVAAVLKDLVLARAQLAVDQDELEMVVDPSRIAASLATLRCQVVDAAGKPLTNARVELSDRQSGGRGTPVDADGRFEQAGLHPGLLEFTVHCRGHHFPQRSITLRPGTVTDLGTLQATSGRSLTIQLEGATPEKEPSVTLTPIDPPPHPALGPGELRLSAQEGRVQVELADGRYRLHVRGAGGAVQTFDTRALGDAPLVVRLAPEAVLQVDSSATSAPTRLVFTNSDGVPVFDRWVTWRSRWNLGLLPGAYQVTTTPLGGAPTSRSLDVPLEGAKLML